MAIPSVLTAIMNGNYYSKVYRDANFFQDSDKALEWCEKKTLSTAQTNEDNIIHFECFVLVEGLAVSKINVINQYFHTMDYQAGSVVIEDS